MLSTPKFYFRLLNSTVRFDSRTLAWARSVSTVSFIHSLKVLKALKEKRKSLRNSTSFYDAFVRTGH